MISVAIWLAIVYLCFGVGAAALRRLRAECDTSAEEIPFAVALGMGVLSYLLLAAGLLGQLKLWVVVALICFLALVGLRQMARLARQAALLVKPRSWRWAGLPLAVFLLVAGACTLIGALAPSTESDYDGLVYHLSIPKLYLRHGSIHSIPWLSHTNFPFTLEMLYLLGLLLRGQAVAKLFHFGCGWLTVLAVFAFGRRWWGARAGLLGAAALAATPIIAWQMTVAYNELAFALYAFLSIYALSLWSRSRPTQGGDGWLWVAGLMCGLALGTKMLAGVVLLFALAALAWGALRGRLPRGGLPQIAAFAALAAVVASPWYVKSYLWTGNPVYPFFYGLFDGKYWSAQRAHEYAEAQGAFGLGRGAFDFLALPWNLTMHSRWFFDLPQQLRPVNVLVWVFGPLFLAFLPALVFAGPVGPPGRLMLWFGLTYVAVWFGLTQNGRYLVPVLPALATCVGLAADRMLARGLLAAASATAALILTLSSALFATCLLISPAIGVALGRESPQHYLDRTSSIYPAFRDINMATPKDAKVLVLGEEPRCFYLDRDYLLGDHANIFSPRDLADPESLLAAFRAMGVTHLLLHASTMRDVAGRVGVMATAIADLAVERAIIDQGTYGPFVLWRIVDESEEKRP